MNTVGFDVLRKRVVAFRDAARHLEIDALVVAGLRATSCTMMSRHSLARERIRGCRSLEAALEAHEVLGEPERPRE